MRVYVLNTGTELLLGDVLNTHLRFIAREIFPFGLRVEEQRTLPDGDAIRRGLLEVFPRAEVVFVTGGLGPTSDDVTRDLVAELLGLELREDASVREAIHHRLAVRQIPMPDSIWRQAQVPAGGEVLPNRNGTAPGIYLPAGLGSTMSSSHLFLLPGPPRELQPMFHDFALPIVRRIAGPGVQTIAMRKFRLANIGESIVEQKVGASLLAIPGLELGYCARPGEVDLRVMGPALAVAEAETIVRRSLGEMIFSEEEEELASMLVHLLSAREETLALAESCTGGSLANRITDVPGASAVLLAGYVVYSNLEKIRSLGVPADLLEEHGAVSEPVARAMAEGARSRAGATHALATTGVAGPDGGSAAKPVGTVFIAISSEKQPTRCSKFFFPSDRSTFKHLVGQSAFDVLRRSL